MRLIVLQSIEPIIRIDLSTINLAGYSCINRHKRRYIRIPLFQVVEES